MAWIPINPGEHSIELARVVMNFAPELPEKAARKMCDMAGPDLAKRLFASGGDIEVSGFQFNPVTGMVPGASKPIFNGRQFLKGVDGANPIEAITLVRAQAVYETRIYSSWTDFMVAVVEGFLPQLQRALEVTDASGFSLEYVDRFVFQGSSNEASPLELLNGLEGLLHGSALSGEEPWHLHKGWFENGGENRFLVNQNFDAQDGRLQDGHAARSVQILTKVEFQRQHSPIEFDDIGPMLSDMHSRSKSLITEVLKPEHVKAIGINHD